MPQLLSDLIADTAKFCAAHSIPVVKLVYANLRARHSHFSKHAFSLSVWASRLLTAQTVPKPKLVINWNMM